MARSARGVIEAGRYHVCSRSAGKIPYFRDDLDRTGFCNRLARVVGRFDWRLEAFCLMDTHHHLLIDVPDERLSAAMRWLNGTYAQQFNRQHGRWGHLCGDRFTLTPIETKLQLIRTFAYIARNPVRAELCELPQDWVWSSYAGSAGYREPFRFIDDRELLAYFGPERGAAQERVRRFVERL